MSCVAARLARDDGVVAGKMSSDEDEDVDVADVKADNPHWSPLVKALTGRFERITADDIWLALHQFNGQVAKASNFLQVLS